MPSGPLAAPSDTTWRRERLLRIGSTSTFAHNPTNDPAPVAGSPTESTSLNGQDNGNVYGTLPNRGRLFKKPSLAPRRSLSLVQSLSQLYRTASGQVISGPSSPLLAAAGFRDLAHASLRTQRPISAYDAPLGDDGHGPEEDISAKINGVRVWYSSFTSIDWLHDEIKDSLRFSKLRKRKSVRDRLRLLLDRSMGWIVVTVVGFLSAIVAFLVVRSEQLLFDLKEGFCTDGWFKAKRFCCPERHDVKLFVSGSWGYGLKEDTCPAWETWANKFSGTRGLEAEIVEYISYAFIAVSFCLYYQLEMV